MISLTLDVLDAYQADQNNAGKSQLAANDGTWLTYAALLERAQRLPIRERGPYLKTGAAAISSESPDDSTAQTIGSWFGDTGPDRSTNAAICASTLFVATDAENAGAFAVAASMLDSARGLVSKSDVRLQGRMLGQQGRILRKLGELDRSWELYDDVGALGARHRDEELVALGHLGKAVIARTRGNNPLSLRELTAVLESPDTTDAFQELHFYAHHGLLVSNAVAGDFEKALRHGSLALAAARNNQQRTEILLNVSSVCYDVRQYRSALNGYLQVLGETRIERIRMSAYGGAVNAAARLEETHIVDTLVGAARELLTNSGCDWELADMSREFAEAYSYLGDADLCGQYQAEALRRARRGRFFEIIHRVESFRPSPRTPRTTPVDLTYDALTVTRELAFGDSQELLLAAVSGDHSDGNSH